MITRHTSESPPIDVPGFYEMEPALYHKDPVKTVSLSSTIAKELIARSPAHGYHKHPRLGGAKDDDETAADPSASKEKMLGEIIHKLVLGKGADIEVVDAKDWRTNAAKEIRDAAFAAGKLPILSHKLPEAQAAAAACRTQLDDMGLDYVFRDGLREVVLVWSNGKSWYRAMIDQLLIDEKTQTAEIFDLKTVSRSSHPEACAKQIGDLGYDLGIEFYRRGLVALRPELAGRIKTRWVFLEVKPPYAATPVEISGEWQMAANSQCDRAIALWQKCMAEKKWPFYTTGIERLSPKPWLIADAFNEET